MRPAAAVRFDLEPLREAVPAVLEAHGYPVPHRGRRMPCPFCGGDNSSQRFSFTATLFHCFACGAGGDVFELVRRLRSCDFRQAVEVVASITGTAPEALPPAEVLQRQRVARRREALRAWRTQRLNATIDRLRELDRDADWVGEMLCRHRGSAVEERLWVLLGDVHRSREEAEAIAADLEVESEELWAARWLEERQRGLC